MILKLIRFLRCTSCIRPRLAYVSTISGGVQHFGRKRNWISGIPTYSRHCIQSSLLRASCVLTAPHQNVIHHICGGRPGRRWPSITPVPFSISVFSSPLCDSQRTRPTAITSWGGMHLSLSRFVVQFFWLHHYH